MVNKRLKGSEISDENNTVSSVITDGKRREVRAILGKAFLERNPEYNPDYLVAFMSRGVPVYVITGTKEADLPLGKIDLSWESAWKRYIDHLEGLKLMSEIHSVTRCEILEN